MNNKLASQRMKPHDNISMQEVEDLLNSPALAAVQKPIADAIGLKVLPHESAFRHHAILRFVDLDTATILRLLTDKREDLICFGTIYQRAESDTDEEEYPPGEELGPDELPETVAVLGLQNGFGLQVLCHFYLLSEKSTEDLDFFLKMQGIPRRKNLASRMRKHYSEAMKANQRIHQAPDGAGDP